MDCLLGFMILAARDRDSRFSWIVPLVFVVIWILGGIGKVYGSYKEGKQQREQSSEGKQEKKMRYKPIPDVSLMSPKRERAIPQAAPVPKVREVMPVSVSVAAKPERKRPGTVASLKKAMHDAMKETYAQQSKSQLPKPVAARARSSRAPVRSQRRAGQKTPVVTRTVTKEPAKVSQPRQQEEMLLSGFLQRENIRKAIIYSEIIGKPLSLREA